MLLLILVILADLLFYFLIPTKQFYTPDPILGWRTKSNNYYKNDKVYDTKNNPFTVEIRTNQYGFRTWGNTKTNKLKILFIGDSFTGDPNMSDKDSYYENVGRLLDAEIFAYGSGGYGTLQELMILNKYLKIINPDIFVLQFCENDYENNSYNLEGESIVRNQKNFRPYLKDGKIVYRQGVAQLYRFFYKFSRIFRRLDGMIQHLQFNVYNGYSPPADVAEKNNRAQLKIEAEQITMELLKEMAILIPENKKKFLFDPSLNYQRKWINLAESAGFTALPKIALAVEEAEKSGAIVRVADGSHWNPLGQKIAGIQLAKDIKLYMHINKAGQR